MSEIAKDVNNGGNEMTPCEEKGYEVGQVFEVVQDNGAFDIGSIVVLTSDDTTHSPRFALVKGFSLCGQEAFCSLGRLKRLWPKEKETVTINVEGRDIVISRESARALNLVK